MIVFPCPQLTLCVFPSQCLGIVQATCMAQGLYCKIDGELCNDKFSQFIDRYYIPFCRQAIQACFTYGFVPWYVGRTSKGDKIPIVLPTGTFHWTTETTPSDNAGTRKHSRDHSLVRYNIQITAATTAVRNEDVNIFTFSSPALDVSVNSMLYATVSSPLSHVLTDYKNLRQAQIRRSHADAWNTTAKLICSFKPNVRIQVISIMIPACFIDVPPN